MNNTPTENSAHTITVWTYGNRPFVMGGDVVYILKTETEAVHRFRARGFNLAVVKDGDGLFRVASEDANGALVSDAHKTQEQAVASVRADMAPVSKLAMQNQVRSACDDFKSRGHEMKDAATFWNMLKGVRA